MAEERERAHNAESRKSVWEINELHTQLTFPCSFKALAKLQ